MFSLRMEYVCVYADGKYANNIAIELSIISNRIIHVIITKCLLDIPQCILFNTRIEFFRKNYREIHGNQRIPKFMGIFTVVTVKITVNSCKNSLDFR